MQVTVQQKLGGRVEGVRTPVPGFWGLVEKWVLRLTSGCGARVHSVQPSEHLLSGDTRCPSGRQAEQTQGADPKPQEPQDRALGGAGGAGVGAEQGQALGGVVAPPGLLGPHALLSQARNLAPEGRGLG